ncbi:succinate dehydrogenase assembly factor 4, mitochondrial [Diutina catenulata]
MTVMKSFAISRAVARSACAVVPRATLSTVAPRLSKFETAPQPGPPKLPKEQQEEFERLQKQAASQAAIDEYNAEATGEHDATAAPNVKPEGVVGNVMYVHTIPEFDGDTNPETGEVGGPKQNPTRHGDWSFNGRVTDF